MKLYTTRTRLQNYCRVANIKSAYKFLRHSRYSDKCMMRSGVVKRRFSTKKRRDCKKAAEYSSDVDDQTNIQTMAGDL